MKLSDPYTKDELKIAIDSLKNNLANSFQAIEENIFFQKPTKGWSPAENVQHLNRVTFALRLTFITPKILASLFFGETKNSSRRMEQMAVVYLEALRQGKDSGFFKAQTENPESKASKRKAELITEWNSEWDKYKLAVDSWSEDELDRVLMPHPFLGKITAREMYMVGILHPVHHANIVSSRLGVNWNYF